MESVPSLSVDARLALGSCRNVPIVSLGQVFRVFLLVGLLLAGLVFLAPV